jgi:cytochrome b561
MYTNSDDSWGWPVRVMHGVGLVLIFILIIHGWWMTEFAPREIRFEQYAWHASFGYAVLLLTAIRLAWRALYKAPGPPAGSVRWERNLASLGHIGLYVFTLCSAGLGWALAGTFSQPLDAKLLGFIPMPMIMSGSALHETLEETHEFFSWLLAALVLFHIIAAGYHQFYKKDSLLQRMFF